MRNSAVSFTKPAVALPYASNNTTSYTHSAWHSPVPYLFGGLAAMLGLIAFALLILACSYWKLSGYLDQSDDPENPNNGDTKTPDPSKNAAPSVYEERIVVIMAGDHKPTFLATPVSSRASSFNDSVNQDGVCSDCGARTVELQQVITSSPSPSLNHDNLQRQQL